MESHESGSWGFQKTTKYHKTFNIILRVGNSETVASPWACLIVSLKVLMCAFES